MQIKLIASAAAIALVAGLGSASAEEQYAAINDMTTPESFLTVGAVPATPLHRFELDRIRGEDTFVLSLSGQFGGSHIGFGFASPKLATHPSVAGPFANCSGLTLGSPGVVGTGC